MRRRIPFLLLIATLLLTACNLPVQPVPAEPAAASPAPVEATAADLTSAPAVDPTAAPAVEGTPTEGNELAAEALKNATYSGIYDQPVTLTDGLYEDGPLTLQYLDGTEMVSDLDGDGAEDAVVFLLERGGGTANILYLAAQLNRDGQPVDAGAVSLDEVQVESTAMADGQIQLELITMGPGDGDCCPSHKAARAFALQDGQLVEVPGEAQELVQVSADDLNGTSWTLVETNYDTPVSPDAAITLSFADGKITGSGGCNTYISRFILGNDNPFVMTTSPVVATQMACPEPVLDQETAFFSALDGAAQWGYEFGHMALYYPDQESGAYGRLLFAPASAETTADDGEGAMAGAPAGQLPAAEIAVDEGGPAVATGEWAYTAAAVARHYLEPVAMLLDMSGPIQRNYTEWAPRSGQIIGVFTRPLAPAPTAYQVNLPVQPAGASVDVDNDGEEDAGVQVFAANLGTNLVGDSYLEQVEQGGFTSYLTDPQTGDIRQGALLVYAPDDAQGFPSAAGEDGVYFTADDPAVGLPAGWTLATLDEDGQVTFDRSREATMDILEAAAYASPDFSDQGILESFNSLIDLLAVRYSYTDLRGLDWEQIRQEYLPRVEAADAAGDFPAYYAAMNDLALSIKDAHVYLSTNSFENKSAAAEPFDQAFGGGLGVEAMELSDGRVVVTYLEPEGPGAQAGWQVGTEIVSVDGVAIGDRIDTLPILESAGNPEVIRLQQTKNALAFPAGAETIIEYRQPEASDVLSATLTAVEGTFAVAPKPAVEDADISFKDLGDGIWYVQWKMFRDPLYKIAVWEKLLTQAQGATGLIIDMRHNGGGATDLMYTLASYLFTADDPAQGHWIDNYTYDEKAGDLVKEFASDRTLSSPRPELTFNGAVAVLVGEGSASAAEYLPQFLQRQGRAIVVGEHGTEGAGGYLEQAAMPGDFIFHFTKGRTYFAGTEELNLEAKGVDLDVRVPISLENELAKQEGRDVVLEAAIVAVGEEAARLFAERLPGTTLQLMTLQALGEDGAFAQVNPTNPLSYTLTFAADGVLSIQAGCNQVNATYSLGSAGAISITPGAATLALCPDDGLGERFVAALAQVALLQTDGQFYVFAYPSEDAPVNILMTPVEDSTGQGESAISDDSKDELPAELTAQLDAWLDSQVYSDGGDPKAAAPGLVLLVDTPDGRYLRAAGVSNAEEGTPMQVDDRLEIGSNTKSFTSVLLLQLQDEGVLSLEDKLGKWLPELAADIPNGDQISLLQLMNHTSGIAECCNEIIGAGIADPARLTEDYTPEALVRNAIENHSPDFAPGEGFNYSNTNYDLMGLVAEAATGQPLAELYQERIFDPLGMESAVLLEGVPQSSEITSQGYYYAGDTRINVTDWNASQGWAAGANAMTAVDLAAYAEGLAAGKLFQKPDTLAQMLAFNPAGAPLLAPYGLGVMDMGDGYWGHGGTTPGFESLWAINPDEGTLIVGLSNSGSYANWNFLNVRNILTGKGAQPFIADYIGPATGADGQGFPVAWQWIRTVDSSGVRELDPTVTISLRKDGTASASSTTCGPVDGTFTASAPDALDFDLDASAVTCLAGDPLVELLGLLDTIASWRFENGEMIIVLEDGMELGFRNPY
ncbi:MAG: serine hydrolase [Caldilineales bacterium]